jgi:hypothetical protein
MADPTLAAVVARRERHRGRRGEPMLVPGSGAGVMGGGWGRVKGRRQYRMFH